MILFDGKLALVTGSGSGIGRATARRLAGLGAAVAVADINFDAANETVETIEADGGTASAFYVDVAEASTVADLRDAVISKLQVPDIVVNNAGWDIIEPFMDNDPKIWAKVVGINFLGPVTVAREFLGAMIERREGGHIVNVASDAGRVGSSGETVYAGAKGGVIAFTKSLAREMARYSINVNCVCPGPTDTPLFNQLSQKRKDRFVQAIPFKRLAQPEDLANVIAFFVSEEASYVTGQVLSVSGGLTMNG